DAQVAAAGGGAEGAVGAHRAAAVGEADLHRAAGGAVGGEELAGLAREPRLAGRARRAARLGAELRGAGVQAVAGMGGRVAGRAVVAERAAQRRADAAARARGLAAVVLVGAHGGAAAPARVAAVGVSGAGGGAALLGAELRADGSDAVVGPVAIAGV